MENPVWTQLSPAVLKVFIYFVLRANWRPTVWFDGEREIVIPRGSLVTSYPQISEKCRISIKQARDAVADLQKLKIGAVSRAPRYTIVTVCNYSTYNPEPAQQGTQQGSIGAGSGQDQGRIRAPLIERIEVVEGVETLFGDLRAPKPKNGKRDHGSTEQAIWFENEFWPIVWAKIGKDATRAEWLLHVRTRSDADRLITAAKEQGPDIMADAIARAARDGTGRPAPLHPRTWIHQGRYEDEPLKCLQKKNGFGHEPVIVEPTREECEQMLKDEDPQLRAVGRETIQRLNMRAAR